MTAEEYFVHHWKKHKVWNRLAKPHHQARLKWCADQCVGLTAIDVGCASGHSTAYMQIFRKDIRWFGTDFAPEIVKYAKMTFPNIDFLEIKGIDTLSEIGPFDSVVCSEVIEHVLCPKSFVDQLWGVTKSRLIITTPSVAVDDPGHLRVFNKATLRELFNFDAIINIKKAGKFWHVIIDRRA